MKKSILTLAIVISSMLIFAQPTPPTSGSGGAGQQGPIGGGAPIDGGFSILLALGALYAGKKLYGIRNKNEE